MFHRTSIRFLIIFAGLCLPAAVCAADVYPRAGWKAKLSTLHHSVSGVVEIVDEDTLRIENFNYDSGGPAVYIYLGAENTSAAFVAGIPAGPLLSGTAYSNDTLTVDLPDGFTMDGYNAVSVWCVDFRVNFGSGTFGSVVEYEVTFDATWSAETHLHFPPNPHFSGLIGGTHDDRVSFWQLGSAASEGIERMAETGEKSPFDAEVGAAIAAGDAYGVISGGGINPSPGSVSQTFEMNSSHPLVTLVSMIAPSPDWFVGVSGLRLFDDGRWVSEAVVVLDPYDAGTDSGIDFTSSNADTDPADTVAVITGFPFEDGVPLGTFTFRLKCPSPPVGDLNADCRVDLQDLAVMAANWALDCSLSPQNPACL